MTKGKRVKRIVESYEQAEDWIEMIIDKACGNYRGRKIVLWGKYEISDIIKAELKKKYGIEAAFYIDSDAAKLDGHEVYPIEHIYGKADEYYIVIALSFYPSIKRCLTEGGYEPEKDYYYFSDCIIRDEPDYYEDAHGNRMTGKHQGLKFAFSGFHSVIDIGANASFSNTCIYIHNHARICMEGGAFSDCIIHLYDNASIVIGKNGRFEKVALSVKQSAGARFGNGVQLTDSDIKMESGADLEVGKEGGICYLSCFVGEQAELFFHEKVLIAADAYQRSRFWSGEHSRFEIGPESRFYGRCGMIIVERSALLKIGKKFSVGDNYRFNADECTEISIGEDCLFSCNVMIRSNDGHSIFDVVTGKNMNSSYETARSRKVMVGNHVWIGMNVVILYNARIEDGSIIGSMSLVKGKIPNNCIAVGIPARVSRKNIAWSHKTGAEDIRECEEKYVRYTEQIT